MIMQLLRNDPVLFGINKQHYTILRTVFANTEKSPTVLYQSYIKGINIQCTKLYS